MKIIQEEIKIKSDTVIGYHCDVCHKRVDIHSIYPELSINSITYFCPSGGWGEGTQEVNVDVCSWKCLLKALKNIQFNVNIHLTGQFIESANAEIQKALED